MTAEATEHCHLVTAGPDDRGRIDAFLAGRIPSLSRSRIKALITTGAVAADGATILDPSQAVKPGGAYSVTVPKAVPATPRGQNIALTVLYEDSDLIVVDKPAGLVVHPAPGNPNNTLVNALIHHCGDSLSGIGGVKRPGIVHRLDKDTSGVMVAAKTDAAHADLVAQFQARTIERAYGALVWGIPSPAQGRITGNIGRSRRNRKKMAVLARGGRSAATNYKVIRAFDGQAAQLECRLESGRTHQIRVHLAHIGHPVIGDAVYGGRGRRAAAIGAPEHQALHAFLLGFRHPISGEVLRFTAPFPPYFNGLIAKLEAL
jgi:23S rRNA pseudouridine1911/1915/1917 synthase